MGLNKYKRSNFISKVEIDGKIEFDFGSSHFNLFKTKHKVRYYQVSKWEAGRPDILSKNIYNNTSYWWILLKYNNIVDVFTELVEGFILKVPHKTDIINFESRVREELIKEKNSKQI